MTDEQILLLLKNDSDREKGFRMLMNNYQELLYRHIRSILKNHEDTNDVLQNTFIKVFRNIEKFEGRSSLYTWTYRIATNEALTHVNKNKKMKLLFNKEDDHNGLENTLIAKESPDGYKVRDLLQQAIAILPEKQRSVFSLRYFEEMSYRQMSEVMETSEGALKASFHHAVKKIERYFKNVNVY